MTAAQDLAHVSPVQRRELAAKVVQLQRRDREVTERLAALPDGGARVRAHVADLNASALVEIVGTDTRLMHDASARDRYQGLVTYLSARPGLNVDANFLLDMHARLCGPTLPFSGRYKSRDVFCYGHFQGQDVVTYVPPGADETPEAIRVAFARHAFAAHEAPSPVLGPLCFCLDLLCIHPFEDGNGRVMRLLLLYLLREQGLTQALHLPFEGTVSRNRFLLDSATRRSNGVRYYESYERFRPAPFLVASLGLLAASYDALDQAEGQG